MEVPGLGSLNNLVRLDPNRVTTPEVTPGKVAEQGPKQAPVQQPLILPHQAPKTPVLTQNQQAFSNLLMEMGIPNTLQNNQLTQVLANYGQPINKQTISQVTLALGPLIQAGPANIEAAVVLMINKLPINQQSVDAVKHLLNSGGLSQNLLGFSKDLQKMVENFSNRQIPEQFSQSKGLISQAIVNNNTQGMASSPVNQQLAGQTAVINSKEGVENARPDSTAIKIKEGKVEEINPAMKNPFQEEPEEDIVSRDTKQNFNKAMPETGLIKREMPEIFNIKNDVLAVNQGLANELSAHAQKINKSIMNLLTIDFLKNPSQFPMQIAMLRKCFSELEIDIKEFKEIILKNFPGILDEKAEEENIFIDLLKLILPEEEANKLKNLKNAKSLQNTTGFESNLIKDIAKDAKALKNMSGFEPNLIKDIAKAAESLNLNMLGREMLTKSMDCMCLPMSIPFNGKFYQVEVMIRREDQSNKKTEVGHVPIKIQLAVETKNMGKIGIDISNLKRDLQVNLSVENKFIQKRVQGALANLQGSLKLLPFDLSPIQCVVNPRPNENTSILLPRKYKVLSMRRIEGLV